MEASANAPLEGEQHVQLPTSMSLGFEHVQSYQIRPNNPPKQVLHEQAAERGAQPAVPPTCSGDGKVLSMRRLGGASAVSQFVEDIPLQLIEMQFSIMSNTQYYIQADGSIGEKQQVWVKKWPNEEGSEKKMAKLLEEEVPEPNAPL